MASTSARVAVSQILRNKDEVGEEEDEPKKKSREDWRKAKELEEARKAGTAPAAVDETGKDINPHIPQYISSAPWYYGTAGPTLKHQRPQEDREASFTKLDTYYHKGVDHSKVSTKFRKGACQNCGAMTHEKKHCLERPRKIGAKFSSVSIAADEFSQPNLNLSYDGKRDRWNGYDPSEHKAIIAEYQKVEDAKRELRAKNLEHDPAAMEDDDNAEEDEDKYVDEVDMPGTKFNMKYMIVMLVIAQAAMIKAEAKECDSTMVSIDYHRETLVSGLYGIQPLNVDHESNDLYFSVINVSDSNQRHTRKYSFKTREMFEIPGVEGRSNQAINQEGREIFLGGANGIYKYNPRKNESTLIGASDKNILRMYYNNDLYFSTYPDYKLYKLHNDKYDLVERLRYQTIEYFVIDDDDTVYFTNTNGLFKKVNDDTDPKLMVDGIRYTIRDLAFGPGNILYATMNDGIYVIDKKTSFREKVADIKEVWGLTFDKYSNIIYSDYWNVYRLTLNKSC